LLTLQAIERLVQDLVIAELKRSRGDSFARQAPSSRDTYLLESHAPAGADCLGMDSLERLSTASRLNQFFHLHEWGVEEWLLRHRTIGELADFITAVLLDETAPWERLTVCTSGTTGEPKQVTHSRGDLEAEVFTWQALLPGISRIVSLIPSHHMYGLIWTALLPGACGCRVVAVRPGEMPRLEAGDLVVAVPFQWEFLLGMGLRFPIGVTGVSSAGELPARLWPELAGRGLERLVEIYGSTETGGVASREAAGAAYRWAPHARREEQLLPDEISSESPDTFRLLRRKDGLVKVGGQLVNLGEVEAVLRAVPGVADCRVRAGQHRLEALLIPQVNADLASLEHAVRAAVSQSLPTAAQPRRLEFAAALPRNEMGKVTAW
jgi:4-coumarate--CoA ligase